MKAIGFITVLLTGSLLIFGTLNFPFWGDPTTPASTYLSSYYIEKAMEDTSVPNIVTAVLADYRGYDTMFETTVIFAAGLACFFLLRKFESKDSKSTLYRHISTGIVIKVEDESKIPKNHESFEQMDSQWTPKDLIVKTTCRLVIPSIQLFAFYVIAHGHYSPGGGFQGGVILGASIILFAISHDLRTTLARLGEKASALLASTGVLIYAGTGILCLILGGAFLDYSALASILGTDPITARSHGILIVEIGVGLAVMMVMVWLYYNISSAGKHDEGL